jgi:hypothetical protein
VRRVDSNLLARSLRPVLHGIAAAYPETEAAIRGVLNPRGLHIYDWTGCICNLWLTSPSGTFNLGSTPTRRYSGTLFINPLLSYFADGGCGLQLVADRFNGLPTTLDRDGIRNE